MAARGAFPVGDFTSDRDVAQCVILLQQVTYVGGEGADGNGRLMGCCSGIGAGRLRPLDVHHARKFLIFSGTRGILSN